MTNAMQILNDLIESDYTECAFREFFNRIESPIKIKKKRILEYSITRKNNYVEIFAKSNVIPRLFKKLNANIGENNYGQKTYQFAGIPELENFYQNLPSYVKRSIVYDTNKIIDYSGTASLIFIRYVGLENGIFYRVKTIATDNIINEYHNAVKETIQYFHAELKKQELI